MELGRLIGTEIRDPRVGFATVTGVKLTADLRQARVFVSVMGPPETEEESVRRLQAAAHFLRRGLAATLPLRHVPELNFELDRTAQQAERVEELLRRVKKTDEG